MEDLLRIALTGLSYGMLLFIISSGLSLVLGAMGLLNLTHGSLYMLGAFLGLAFVAWLGSFWLAALLAGLSVGLLGLLLERLFLSRLHRRLNDQVLLTLGFVSIFANLSLWIWGAYPLLGRAPAWLDFSIPLGRLDVPAYRLALIAIGLVVAAGQWWLQERTRAGAIVRAGMDDRQMTMALGINYRLVSAGVFFFGAFLAGFAGFIGAPITGASWDMGFPILILALIVVVVGGVGRVEGTLAGALLIGLIDSLGKTFFPAFAQYILYLTFILVLLFRPAGLFGVVPLAPSPPPSGEALPLVGSARSFPRAWQRVAARFGPLLLVGLVFLLLPPLVPPYLRTLMMQILIYGIFALSLNLLFGTTGLFSLGHAAYFGVAAYTTAILASRGGVSSFWLLLPAGVLAAALVAALFGLVALRVSGVYFLFVTMALGELLVAVANSWVAQTGGSNGIFGIPVPSLLPGVRLSQLGLLYLALAVFALSAAALSALTRSPFGLALQGIRDDEGRMRQLGYDTWRFKYLAFIIAGAFAGVAGVLFAPFSSTVVPSFLGATSSSLLMLMVIIGGGRVFWGPVLGAAIILFLQYYVSLVVPERWPLVLGLIFVLAVLLVPGGLSGYLERLWGHMVSRLARTDQGAQPSVGDAVRDGPLPVASATPRTKDQ